MCTARPVLLLSLNGQPHDHITWAVDKGAGPVLYVGADTVQHIRVLTLPRSRHVASSARDRALRPRAPGRPTNGNCRHKRKNRQQPMSVGDTKEAIFGIFQSRWKGNVILKLQKSLLRVFLRRYYGNWYH